VRVTTVDKSKAVVFCLLAFLTLLLQCLFSVFQSSLRFSERKGRLSFIHFESRVPRDDAIVVSAGRQKKLWDSLSELRSSLCERRLERTVLRPALLSVKTAQFTQVLRQV